MVEPETTSLLPGLGSDLGTEPEDPHRTVDFTSDGCGRVEVPMSVQGVPLEPRLDSDRPEERRVGQTSMSPVTPRPLFLPKGVPSAGLGLGRGKRSCVRTRRPSAGSSSPPRSFSQNS